MAPAPCLAWIALKRLTIVSSARGQSTAAALPPRSDRNSGVRARSGAASGARASQPLGQAIPRLTG